MDTRKDQGREYAQGAMMSPSPEPEMIAMDEAVGIPMPGVPAKRPVSPLQESLRRLRRDTRAMVSIGVLVFLVLVALIGPSIYTHIGSSFVSSVTNQSIGPQDYHGYTHEELENQDQGPSAMYWLGTDNLGRDELARLMQGLLVSLFVAVFVEIFDITLGVLVGVLAGYYGGIIDQFLARFTDLMLAFPGLLLIILVAGIFGPSADTAFAHIPILGANGNARLLLVGIVIAVTAWPLMARVVRGQTLQLKEQQFVEAARTSGTTNARIIMRHIIPNLFSVVIIVATLDISVTIISEAGISVLGLGVQPPGSSIGLMISEAQNYISTHPWEELLPCIALIIIVLCFSFIGDGVRDAFDPRSKD